VQGGEFPASSAKQTGHDERALEEVVAKIAAQCSYAPIQSRWVVKFWQDGAPYLHCVALFASGMLYEATCS
jgi:hypothetical protein